MTYLTSGEVKDIVHASALQIHLFLGKADPKGHTGEARQAIEEFHKDPGGFTEEALVENGADIGRAHKFAARIELRGANPGGAAQVAAKGVWGEARQRAREALVKEMKRYGDALSIRLAGASSIEFNRAGVDKSLPLKYARCRWNEVLSAMGYKPGAWIDSRKGRVLIASDGDDTLYERPRPASIQLLKDTPAFGPLLKYLRAGGVFMLISGNDLVRTYRRVIEGLPKDVYNRFLICANGGADLAYLDRQGKPVFMEEYRRKALSAAAAAAKNPALDIFYMGDDPSPAGNDVPAFKTVGKARTVLVEGLHGSKKFLEKWLHERKIGPA